MIKALITLDYANTDTTNQRFIIQGQIYATDGTNDYPVGFTSYLPYTLFTNHEAINRKIREDAAARLLSAHSVTIDPEDIFFPGY